MTDFITANALKTKLADRLGMAGAQVDQDTSWWDGIVHDAHRHAHNLIRRSLLARGFTIAQIQNWDDGEEYVVRLGLCYCFKHAGMTRGVDPTLILETCKAREELKNEPIVVDDALSTGGGSVGYGAMERTDDTYVYGEDQW